MLLNLWWYQDSLYLYFYLRSKPQLNTVIICSEKDKQIVDWLCSKWERIGRGRVVRKGWINKSIDPIKQYGLQTKPDGTLEFLVRWKNFTPKADSWEPTAMLDNGEDNWHVVELRKYVHYIIASLIDWVTSLKLGFIRKGIVLSFEPIW